MKKLLGFLLALVLTPLAALANGWILREFWSLFIAKQYGVGPTYSTWYGICCLSAVAAMLLQMGLARDEALSKARTDAPIKMSIVTSLVFTCHLLLLLAVAWSTGLVIGWC